MSVTNYGVNAPEAVKLWSRKLAREALKETYAGRFIGESKNSLVVQKDDTKKSAGDRIRCTLRMQLSGDGVQGDATLEGSEEQLTTYTDDLVINQLRHAVSAGGEMSKQRIPFSAREECMDGLKDWWAERLDTAFFNQICGYTPQTDTKYTGNNAVFAPSASRAVWADAGSDGNAADESVASDDIFTLSLIDKCVERAKLASPVFRPLKIDGKSCYVMFLHPNQVYDLRTNTNSGQWLDIQKAAMQGGKNSKGADGVNGVFDGALGMYNNVILHESTRVTNGVNSSSGAAIPTVRRAAFCGAQAAHIGFGKKHGPNQYSWVEKLFDYDNTLGVSAGCIMGMKKTRWNNSDFATITASTYAVNH